MAGPPGGGAVEESGERESGAFYIAPGPGIGNPVVGW
jgi:hypothetical protein